MAFASVGGEDSRRQSMKPAPKQLAGALGQQKPTGKRSRQPASQPVDADDLRRRLYVVISQREAAKERRRQTRMEETVKKPAEADMTATTTSKAQQSKAVESIPVQEPTSQKGTSPPENRNVEKTSSSSRKPTSRTVSDNNNKDTSRRLSEPYIPQEAASQFARTATAHAPADKSKIHELSHDALRLHTETTPAATRARSLRKVQSERERLRDRHQIHSARILEEEACDNDNNNEEPLLSSSTLAERRMKQRYTIPSYEHTATARRRSSAAGLARQSDEHQRHSTIRIVESADEFARLDLHALQLRINSGTVDWTQSDENGDEKKQQQQQRSGMRSPLLRKVDSILGLKEKLGKNNGDGNDDTMTSPPTTADLVVEKVEAMVPKPVKKGFWTKIRRHVAAVHV